MAYGAIIGQVNGDSNFIVTYGSTTSAEIESAYQAGRLLWCKDPNTSYTLPLLQRVSATQHIFANENIQYVCNADAWTSGSSMYEASTVDLEAGVSPLGNNKLYFVYPEE